jgi:imidazole glycerol-phosphate synthase subunit HisH
MTKITVINYGAGNLASINYALKRLNVEVEITYDANVLRKAEKIILPGVGHAAAAIKELKNKRLDLVIPQLQVPVLGICLGMQLMCSYSEEGNVPGLNIFSEAVFRFKTNLKVPHIGWNTISDLQSPLFLGINKSAEVYFVHSYFVPKGNKTIAITEYEHVFSAALQNNNFFGVQFHPEKSGLIGETILRNFIKL